MTTTISREQADTADAVALITELENVLDPLYAQESRHGYSVEKLLQQDVDFFVLRVGGEPAGCGGIEFVGRAYGEIKRMYVRPQYRGLGLGNLMLDYLQTLAQENEVSLLRLETGIYQEAAIRLYERYGFERTPPFGEYKEDPASLFFEKRVP